MLRSLFSLVSRREFYALELYASAGILEWGMRKLLTLYQEHKNKSLILNGAISIWRSACEGAWRIFSAVCYPSNAIAQYFLPFAPHSLYHGEHHHAYHFRDRHHVVYFGAFPNSTVIFAVHAVFFPVHFSIAARLVRPFLVAIGLDSFNTLFIHKVLNAFHIDSILENSGALLGLGTGTRGSGVSGMRSTRLASPSTSQAEGGASSQIIVTHSGSFNSTGSFVGELGSHIAVSIVEQLCVLHFKVMLLRLFLDLYRSNPRSNVMLDDFSSGGAEGDVFYADGYAQETTKTHGDRVTQSEGDPTLRDQAAYVSSIMTSVNPSSIFEDYKIQLLLCTSAIVVGAVLVVHSGYRIYTTIQEAIAATPVLSK